MNNNLWVQVLKVAEVVPLKQGLKLTCCCCCCCCCFFVAEVVPLKQGLKPTSANGKEIEVV